MIKSKYNIVAYRIFSLLTKLLIYRYFNSTYIIGNSYQSDKSCLLISNHISWWDGFWILYYNNRILKKRFHFMMLESQLIKHWYFKFIGGFSVKPNSRDALNSIKYCTKLLTDESNLVIIFPQGKINSLYQNKFIFKSGIDKIVENSELDNNIILIVNLIDYLSNKKPNLYIYHKTLNKKDIKGMKIQDLYQNFYNECQDKQKQKTD